eukprot:GHVN01092244.1.p1 GENE.GHVN01092244.1~~GHVN01092244.1.p1  ORF type:complete len:671 (+),score=141.94 GHVN01092244.1:79-2013(+)
MTDAQKRDLEKLIEQRQLDLEAKRKALEELRKTTGRSGSSAGGDSVALHAEVPSTAQSLLGDVMNMMGSAPPPVDHSGVESEVVSKSKKLSASLLTGVSSVLTKRRGFTGRHSLSAAHESVNVTITPSTVDLFEKSIQADIPLDVPAQSGLEMSKSPRPGPTPTGPPKEKTKITPQEVYLLSRRNTGGNLHVLASSQHTAGHLAAADEVGETPELTEEEKKDIITSLHFTEFFDKTTTLVERALGEQMFDVFADYSGYVNQGDDMQSGAERVKEFARFVDDRWTANRPITDIRTSPVFNELFLCSYGQKQNASLTDPDGLVALWSLGLTTRPEYIFTCQSPVCTATFHRFQPHVIIGATYTGSILVWDTRAKMSPVQRTPLTTKGHAHPVYSMELVGTQNAHNLVTVDTDGRLCLWSLGMMVHPTEAVDLKRGNRDVSCLCAGFSEGETNVLFGGTEDGALFQAQIHGGKAGISETYEAHYAPVTSVHWHPTIDSQSIDFTDLLLSTSFDWTVKLWAPKSIQRPIHSFEMSEDYVYDAKWHPTHPGVFATVDGEGYLDIWDINRDIEIPVARAQQPDGALNRVAFSQDGKRVMAGDGYGKLTVWGLSPDLCQCKPDDWTALEEKIEEVKSSEGPAGAAVPDRGY